MPLTLIPEAEFARTHSQQTRRKIGEGVRRARQKLKDPKGGLTAAGRKYYAEKFGNKLRPGVTRHGKQMSTTDLKRKGSWAVRFYGRKDLPPLVKPNGEPTRLALSARAWGEPVPKTPEQARKIAAKGRRFLERYKRIKAKKGNFSRAEFQRTKFQKKVGKVMKEWKQGALKSSAGKAVRSRRQAIAIALSEARKSAQERKAKFRAGLERVAEFKKRRTAKWLAAVRRAAKRRKKSGPPKGYGASRFATNLLAGTAGAIAAEELAAKPLDRAIANKYGLPAQPDLKRRYLAGIIGGLGAYGASDLALRGLDRLYGRR